MESETHLKGKEAIKAVVKRSWSKIKDWILKEGFPAKKIDGVWESDSDLIREWRRRRILKRGE
jgi:hypothetical protein